MTTQYFVRRDLESGRVMQLARIVHEPGYAASERWWAGEWIDDPEVVRFLWNGDADEISESEAQTIIAALLARRPRDPDP